MEINNIFWIAMQSSFVLGLVHGINPCGHSWLILAPFVVGEKEGGKVIFLTASFLAGTTLASVLLGMTLGAISLAIPSYFESWVDIVTSVLLMIIGAILLIKPHVLHHHGHNDHEGEACSTHNTHMYNGSNGLTKKQKITGTAIFTIGFVNMIIPCPTVAIMYKYALDSGNYVSATLVFLVYALATGITVAGVIYGIYRITGLLKTMCQDWIETAIMRVAGGIIIFFGIYAIFQH